MTIYCQTLRIFNIPDPSPSLAMRFFKCFLLIQESSFQNKQFSVRWARFIYLFSGPLSLWILSIYLALEPNFFSYFFLKFYCLTFKQNLNLLLYEALYNNMRFTYKRSSLIWAIVNAGTFLWSMSMCVLLEYKDEIPPFFFLLCFDHNWTLPPEATTPRGNSSWSHHPRGIL